MFHTLENTWDQSARRGWTTAASFTMQALAMSLLLLVPLFTIQGPPRLAWFDPHLLAPPPAPPAPAPPGLRGAHRSNFDGIQIVAPPSIPETIAQIDDRSVAPAPDVSGINIPGAIGDRGSRSVIPGGLGEGPTNAPPPPPASARPLQVSHWAEGNLIYRVQPNYPPLARQARIQGTVELRAIISKMGTIENLTVVSGHAMLVSSAVEAVKQWRYRPYLLNGEPIEVETEITVNFILGGS
jgi:protein TonB